MKLYCYQRDETPFWYTLQTMFLQNSLSYLELSCELFHESHLRCPCSRNNSVYNAFVLIYYHDIVNLMLIVFLLSFQECLKCEQMREILLSLSDWLEYNTQTAKQFNVIVHVFQGQDIKTQLYDFQTSLYVRTMRRSLLNAH